MKKITVEVAAACLGIAADCKDETEINKAFRKASLKCHPDKTGHLAEEEQAKARE